MAYACFFYPLATLGFESCIRTLELAVRLRAETSGGSKENFHQNLRLLIQRGIVPAADETAWDAARKLRNAASHPDGRFLTDPGQALSLLDHTAEKIAFLFPAGPGAALGKSART